MFSSSSYLPIFWKAMSSRFPLLDLYTRSDKTGFYHLHMKPTNAPFRELSS